jgi:methyl-accepting chemotaxis protein
VVLVVSLSLGILAIAISTGVVERNAIQSMWSQAEIASDLVSETVHSKLNVLQEMANQENVRSMDFETQKAALITEIDRTGADDFAIVYKDGLSPHLKSGQAPDLSGRDYVQKGLRGVQSISDIIVGGAVDSPYLLTNYVTPYPLINYVVPIWANGMVVGALMARNNASIFSDIVKNLRVQSGGQAYLLNGAGVVIAHYDETLVMNQADGQAYSPDDAKAVAVRQGDTLVMNQFSAIKAAETDLAYKSEADAVRIILSQKSGSMSHDIEGKRMLISFSPVRDFDMILVVMAERDIVLEELTTMRNMILIMVGVFMVAGVLAALLIARSIIKPIINVTETLKDISEGEGDLTRTIDVHSKDELGDLAHYFNATLAKIKALVTTIKWQSTELLDIGTELASNMTETAATINEITTNIQSIRERIMNQSASVTENNATMKQITVNIDRLNENVDKQTISVSRSSNATEKMLANINSVTQTLAKNIGGVRELLDASNMGRTGLEDVADDIREIARESEGLLEINAVMENIASQTNLLSMNAAIEAAHAGEAGKGFTVVADEIRKLAESSSEQSKTISTVLKKIKESIDKITKSTDNVLNRFEAIDSSVKTVSEQTENICSAMEEQSVGSQQMLEVIGQLNDITLMVKGGSDEMLEGSREVITEGENLGMATAEITNGMNEMAAGADQINIAVHRVSEISDQNKENIDILVKEVSRFKV